MPDNEFTIEDYLAAFAIDEKLMEKYELYILRDSIRYQNEMRSVLLDELTKIISDKDGRVSAGQNAQILREVELQLERFLSGPKHRKFREDLLDTLDRRLKTINDFMIQGGLPQAIVDQPEKLPVVLDLLDDLEKRFESGTNWTKGEFQRLFAEVRGDIEAGRNVTVDDLEELLIQKGKVLPRYARGVAQVNLAAIDREVRHVQTKEAGIPQEKYVGPLDSVTRPFCQGMVGEIKAVEEWEGTYNNVGPNPASRYCGGWGCRHRLIPWRPEWNE